MALHLFEDNDFLTDVFNAIPFPILVVDGDVRILFRNSATVRFIGNEELLHQRGGELLHCIHSKDSEKGCGDGPFCKTCVVRNSVNESNRGRKVYRKKTMMELKKGENISEVPLLITTSPFTFEKRSLILLILEDIHEMMQLGGLLPICSKCKKIRSGMDQWEQIEGYIKKHIIDVDFTHGLCPDCIKEVYPEYAAKKQK